MGANVEILTQRIGLALRDANNNSWSADGIHDAILEAEKVIVTYRPDASATTVTFSCAAGTRQNIAALTDPAPHRLLDVECNMPAGVEGRAVNLTAKGDLDRIRPNWRAATQSGTIREYTFDSRIPLEFDVNPPAVAATQVRISYSGIPAPYGTVDSNTETTVSDLYEPHLIEWALYRLFGHDVENSVNISRSQQHLNNFGNMMGLQIQGEKIMGPKNLEHKR